MSETDAAPPATALERFERTRRCAAEAIAVEIPPGEGRCGKPRPRIRWTYAELARRADAIALALAPRVGAETLVALLLPRARPELWAAQLGAWRAGAAFAPLEPAVPDEWLGELLAVLDPAVLVTDADGAARARRLGLPAARILDLDGSAPAEVDPSRTASFPTPAPGQLAYLIHTSGTTGAPKGVEIEHRSFAALVEGDLVEFALGPGDRVAQGSSPAYDSSLEEAWLAFAAGATLVVLDEQTVRLGPDLVPWLARERISAIGPPPTLLRAMGPIEPARDLPALRLCYVGGEPLPADLAERFSRGPRLVNGYGPTECTVTCLRGDVRPGEEVTIGRPVPGTRAYVLGADLAELPCGEVGELVIAGLSLARGYRGDPKRTAERFPHHPRLGRIYRTGDLARRLPDGRFVHLGRADAQVKIRGHRLELEAIEARLARLPGVHAAGCAAVGTPSRARLVALVVPSASRRALSGEELRAALARELPAHAVPARIEIAAHLPTTAGGKLDRRAIAAHFDVQRPGGGGVERGEGRGEKASFERGSPPGPAGEQRPIESRGVLTDGPASGEDALVARIAAVIGEVLELGTAAPAEADFFLELGGDSLAAAELVTTLRADPRTRALSVRDLYERRTAAGLAEAAASSVGLAGAWGRDVAAADRPGGGPAVRPRLATLLQLGWIALELLVGSVVAWFSVFQVLPWLAIHFGALGTLLVLPPAALVLFLAWTPFSIAATALLKRLWIGEYRPGRVPAWTLFHVRHWLVTRAAGAIPWGLLSGTELASVALRALGAKVGRRVHVHRGVDLSGGGWDLIEIGDEAVLGRDAAVRAIELEEGALVLGRVRVGARATLEVRAGASCGSEVGDGALLGPHAWLAAGSRVPAGERWEGVPAGPAGSAPPPPEPEGPSLSPVRFAVLTLAVRLGLAALLALPVWLVLVAFVLTFGIEGRDIVSWLEAPSFSAPLVSTWLAAASLALVVSLLLEAWLARRLGPRSAGTLQLWSREWACADLALSLVRAAGSWLSGALLWPRWLRAAGMRVGRRCEVSTILDTPPRLVTLADECFLADGVYLAGPRLRPGSATFAETVLEAGSFVGNHAVVPAGGRLAAGSLLGVATVLDSERMRGGGVWFGNPPFQLARRPESDWGREVTVEPTPIRRLTRWFWELLRFTLPWPGMLLALGWIGFVADLGAERGVAAQVLAAALGTLLVALAALAGTFGAKWLLLGRVRPGRHPLWSCWCSRWDFLYVLWGVLGRGVLARLEGTLALAPLLRLAGARIGRRVLLGGGFAQLVDPDMITIGDRATVAGHFQAHSFEERVLRIDRLRIEEDATVGPEAVLFYGAVVGPRARVRPHGVVSKGERLEPDLDHAGIPTRPQPRRSFGGERPRVGHSAKSGAGERAGERE